MLNSYGMESMGAGLLLMLLAHCVMSAPMVRRDVDIDDGVIVTPPSVDTLAGQLAYLERNAWLGETNPNQMIAGLTDKEQVVEAVKEFQRFANLTMTGIMDEATVEKMKQPRCGVPDNYNMATQNKRRKRYALQGSRWENPELSYRINSAYYTPDLDPTKVDNIIKQAFNVWSEVTPLKFTEKPWGNVDIDIEFRSGEHGDGNTFDAQGGTLAHAFFPQYGGDAHFDESENWSHESYQGTNLLQVAVHEFGHSLGLSHSDVQSAIMAPFYGGYDSNLQLDSDDINAIQRIYGRKPSGTVTTTTTTPRTPSVKTTRATTVPDICRDGTFDAITNTQDLLTDSTSTFAFRGDKYVKLENDGVASGYPRRIASDWPGLPNNLDAGLHWPTSSLGTARTYFFKGEDYYKYETKNGVHRMLSGYPKKIRNGFSGIPDNLDAAFVWSGNGKTYFIKDAQYYRYRRGAGLDQGYPRALQLWTGLPSRIDGAFAWTNGKTYFFDGPNYYRFNDYNFNVDSGYPRLNSIWWLGCPEQSGNSEVEVEETEMTSEDKDIFINVETVGTSGAAKNFSHSMSSLVLMMTSLLWAFVQTK